uniref:Uncharacterized protein n=1 Tax=Desulfovibrio sp. U5L TaxID=596152 RepID=I2PZ59_9BACT
MDINTSYDSLTQLLKIASGNASATTGSSGSATTSVANSSTKGDTDTTSWSTVAKALSSLDSDFVSPILQYKAQNKALQQQLTQTLAAKFTDLGIDTSQTITLGRDADGTVTVQNDHPDKDKIDKLFKDTPVLAQAFNTLADNSTTLKSMTAKQTNTMIRTNGYAAYLNQLTSDTSSSDYFLSLMGQQASSYFG